MSGELNPENPILQRVYALKGADECEAVYDEWAGAYDRDTVEGMGYVAPAIAAGRLAELVTPDTEVLDAGCGTGLVGAELARLGFTSVDGLDLSGEMLARARERGVYRTLGKADLTAPLPAEDDAYGAVICVGTFTKGHVGPAALGELLRVLAPGRPLVATVLSAAWEEMGFAEYLRELEPRGLGRVGEVRSGSPYHGKEDITCELVTLVAS
jgi:SAM-dependent methyltransferase